MAFSIDWPGWSRGAKTAELALETLKAYRERYRPIAALAGMAREFDAAGRIRIVEDKVGTGSTDFWGIPFAPSTFEQGPMSEADLERGIALLQACWTFFDDVAERVSPEMRKGPRGGGRERDEIIRHAIRTESLDFAKQVGLRETDGAALTPAGLRQHRKAYVEAMRAYNEGRIERRMRSWTLPFLIRHSAFHTLDHAWEMEDKDLTVAAVAYDEDVADRIRELMGRTRFTEQRMFGGVAFLIGGNMAIAASGHGGFLVRGDPARSEDGRAKTGAQPMVMRRRGSTPTLNSGRWPLRLPSCVQASGRFCCCTPGPS